MGVRGGEVGCSIALKAGKSRARIPMGSFFLLTSTFGPTVALGVPGAPPGR